MDKLGPWLSASLRHLQEHWQRHLLPAVAFFGIIMVLYMVVGALWFVLVFAAAFIDDALGTGGLVSLAAMALSALLFLLVTLLIAPLQIGYIRGTLKLIRGGDLGVGDLTSGLRDAPKAIAVMAIVMIAVTTGALFCYIPGLLVGALLFFAIVLHADQGLGPIEAVKRSIEMAKPHFVAILVYMLILGMIVGFAGYIPIVGPLLSVPLSISMLIFPYLDLIGEEVDDLG